MAALRATVLWAAAPQLIARNLGGIGNHWVSGIPVIIVAVLSGGVQGKSSPTDPRGCIWSRVEDGEHRAIDTADIWAADDSEASRRGREGIAAINSPKKSLRGLINHSLIVQQSS
jgi:hypothetical protein